MAKYLICQICGEKLEFNPHCPCCLGEHLLKQHPTLSMVHFSHEDLVCKCDTSTNNMCFKKNKSSNKNMNTRSKVLFKTTVETWQEGPLKMQCPKCNIQDRPCIRKQRNRVATSHFGALLLLGCWPICFLPCLTPTGNYLELYCKHCGQYLGQYDKKTGNVKCPCPNGQQDDVVMPNIC